MTDYVRYPDAISITPQENAVHETGNTIKFTASVYPEDTTERDIIWKVTGGATISQSGLLQITDSGEITVKAYSSNYKTVSGVKLVISDAHTGLKSAISKKLAGAQWQRCRVHFMRNVLAQVPQKQKGLVSAIVRTIFTTENKLEAKKQLSEVVNQLQGNRYYP